jgi:hypothetical protein
LRKKFLTGIESVEDASCDSNSKTNVSNVREIIESDGRQRIRDIAKAVRSLLLMHFILKRISKYQRSLPDGYPIY